MELYSKLARLYMPDRLEAGQEIALPAEQAHYLKNVLRKNERDSLRIFNAKDGEWEAALTMLGKKNAAAILQKLLRPPPPQENPVHLFFALIKKQRLEMMIEKAVELGVTDLHPVYTERTQQRHINVERLNAQVVEAAEQCERMTVPILHAPQTLMHMVENWPRDKSIYWCLEQPGLKPISVIKNSAEWAFLIGPEGGFSPQEIEMIKKYENFMPVTLGERVLRAETACFLCLSHVQLQNILR
jgi:16S rRNA (uracil1498-N3)-methyltransferase